MKKLLALVLALSLCVLPVVTAQAAEPLLPEKLIEVLASVDSSFSGTPDSVTAWVAMSNLANQYDAETYTEEGVQQLYNSLFAQGAFSDIAEEPCELFSLRDEGGYTLMHAAGEAATLIAINAMDENEDGTYTVDFSAWYDGNGGYEAFRCNGKVVIEEDETSIFGFRAISYSSSGDLCNAFDTASADEVLGEQYDNDYAPENAIDGDFATCWAYTGSELCPALTLSAQETQTVRGIVITSGYAKNEDIFAKNDRIAQVEVTFADGNVKTFDLAEAECYDGMRVLPFEEAVETDSITIVVTGVYSGSKYDDVCVSEIQIF